VQEVSPSVRALLASRIHDFHVVEDLVQETFVAAFEDLERFDDEKDLGAWIRGIALNKVRMHLRRLYSHTDAMARLREFVAERLATLTPAGPDRFERLNQCLRELPGKIQEIFRAHYFEEERVVDIATRLKKSSNAISSILCRGRQQLRSCVEGTP
jgi:RNA polymerase sigma-70 factor (ECF subfamily)